MLIEGDSFKPRRLTRLTAYVFAGVAKKFCGGLWLSTFHGGLRRLTTAALGSTARYTLVSHHVVKINLNTANSRKI